MPRKPRDLESYVPTGQAADSLRQAADMLEKRAAAGELMKWTLKVQLYTPEAREGKTDGR